MEAAIRNGKSVRLSVRLGALLFAFALTFSACTVGRLKEDPSRESTNPRPENYKSDILAMLHVYLRVCPKTSGGITKFSEHEAD